MKKKPAGQCIYPAIEIVDFPIKNGDFPVRYVNVYQRVEDGVARVTCVLPSSDTVYSWRTWTNTEKKNM